MADRVPLEFQDVPSEEMRSRALEFYQDMRRRRTVREFSPEAVPREVIENALLTAGAAPSGANQQPWQFVVVSNPDLKRQIRQVAEVEERAFYGGRAPQDWLDALGPLGTDANKPFLEVAPYLIVIFAQTYGLRSGGNLKHYYVQESVGIATGFLIAALHRSGLATLTHTPNPMGFLNTLLERPSNERAFLILVVGKAAEGATVPAISKKLLSEIATFVE